MNIIKSCNIFYNLYKFGIFEEPQKIKYFPDLIDAVVEKHNIKGRQIGNGDYSVVYSDGLVVTKLTFNKSDCYNLFVLDKLKDKIPEKYHKHIIEVYDIDYDEEYAVYITTVELLKPIQKLPELSYIINATRFSRRILSIY